MNTPPFVNTVHPRFDSRMEEAAHAKLGEILGEVPWLQGWELSPEGRLGRRRYDLLATLPLPNGGRAALCVECKGTFRPSEFPLLARREMSPPGHPALIVPVLALPWVTPRMAELCREHGWGWFDLAGNHRLDVPGLLRLERTGLPPVHEPPRPAANLSTRESGRVIRVLLAPDNAGQRWTQRSMAQHFGALPRPMRPSSLSLINKVVKHLRNEAFIEESADGGFRLVDPLRLLFAWRDAWRVDRHERRGYFTLQQGRKLRESLAGLDLIPNGYAAYAAFSAAEFQAPNVRQPKTWLYLSPSLEEEFRGRVEAEPVDSGENLVVWLAGDDGVFYLPDAGAGEVRLPCTNVVQTYVDLAHAGGRGAEAAEALLEQRIKPEWKLRGVAL